MLLQQPLTVFLLLLVLLVSPKHVLSHITSYPFQLQSCCERLTPGDLHDLYTFKSGIYSIKMSTFSSTNVWCDMTRGDSGWMLITRRSNDETNFDRLYHEYEDGFGELKEDFWIGLRSLQTLTQKRPYELKLDMFSYSDDTEPIAVAHYSSFEIGNPNYTLKLGNFTGSNPNLLNNLIQFNGKQFSAKEDLLDASNPCFYYFHGGWWFVDNYCVASKGQHPHPGSILTRPYQSLRWYDLSRLTEEPPVIWKYFGKYELKIRPKDCKIAYTR